MVIKFYKKCLLSVLLIAPGAIFAEWGISDAAKDVTQGSLGWTAHLGLGYLGYKGYQAFTADPAQEIFKIAGKKIARNDLITLSATALGSAAVYHGALFWQYCTFGVQLRKMKRSNTGTNPLFRNRWADCATAAELIAQVPIYSGGRDALKRQLLLNMGLEQNTAPLEAIKKIDTALTKLYERLKSYESYTNIVELTAQTMIDEDSDALALLGGDVLITDNLNCYSEDILNKYAKNSWIANSATIGFFFKEDCYLKRPWLYTATYNMASHCAMKTLEQFARLKAVRHILELYVPENQRYQHVIVNQLQQH